MTATFSYVDTIFVKPRHGFGKNRPFPNADKKEFSLLELDGKHYIFDLDDNYGPLKIGEVVQEGEEDGWNDNWTLTGNWFIVDSESLQGFNGTRPTYDLIHAGCQLAADAGLV